MSDTTASRSEEAASKTSGGEGETRTCAGDVTLTRPSGKLYPLNSPRLATDVIKSVAVQLELPGTASRADTCPMLEGKLAHEPRNVQVRITVGEDSSQTIELMDAGTFLRAEVPAEDETGDGTEAEEGLRTQLEETCTQNECLPEEDAHN